MGSAASVSQSSDDVSEDEIRSLCSKGYEDIYRIFDLLKDKRGHLSKVVYSKYYEAFKVFDSDDQSVDKPQALHIVDALGFEMESFIFSDERVHISGLIAQLVPKLTAVVEAFRHIDKNGDGTIEAVEIVEAMKEAGEAITIDEATDIIQHADMNGDGRLDLLEYMKMSAPE